MLCDECHKNEAVITYTEVVRGVRRELHLCKECAAKHTDKALEPLGDSFLADLLAGIFGLDKDEDERDWARHCAQHASWLCKPIRKHKGHGR